VHLAKTEGCEFSGLAIGISLKSVRYSAWPCLRSIAVNGRASAFRTATEIDSKQKSARVGGAKCYPDPLLAQTLAASTYPLEVIQLQQWIANSRYLKDQALADAVEMHPWDPTFKECAFGDVVSLLSDNFVWMTDLGNALLAQQGDVMNAVQRMRAEGSEERQLK
jgi:hypothetical protein